MFQEPEPHTCAVASPQLCSYVTPHHFSPATSCIEITTFTIMKNPDPDPLKDLLESVWGKRRTTGRMAQKENMTERGPKSLSAPRL